MRKEDSPPSKCCSKQQHENVISQKTPRGVHRHHFTQPAVIDLTSNKHTVIDFIDTKTTVKDLTAASSTVQINTQTQGNITSSNESSPLVAIPTGAKMRVVQTEPTQADCQIQFHDPTTNAQLDLPTITVERDTRTSYSNRLVSQKATGVLCRSNVVPLKVTVSGWSQHSKLEHQLDNTKWTARALKEMCVAIKHTPEPHRFDHHRAPGKFEASHVEKQLLAYVYSKLEAARYYASHPARAPAGDEMDWVQTFEDLFIEKWIIIYVDGPYVCQDCKACAAAFERATNIRVDIYVSEQV